MKSKPNVGLLIAVSVAGLILSAVLEVVHVTSNLRVTAESFCTVNETLDCGAVALSRFSVFLGIPTPIWGMASFLAALLAAVRRSSLFLPLAGVGTALSVALFLESWLGVGALCFLCEGVHLAWVVLLVLGWKKRDGFRSRRWSREVWETLAIPGALLILTAIAVPHYWVFVGWTAPPDLPNGFDAEQNAWIGSEDPEHVVEEFIDYGCPHCKVASNQTKMRLENASGIRLVRRNQPRLRCTQKAKSSCLSLRAAICAGEQGKFWEMDSWLFAHAPGEALVDAAPSIEDVGLVEADFNQCLEDDATWTKAAAEAKEARDRKVRETPGYFIDGERATLEEVRALF